MALYHRPWPPTSAPAACLDPAAPIEEETLPRYTPDRFYPIRLGQILDGRYQIATKLGFGSKSTVWLARDLYQWQWLDEKYVAIKVKTRKKPSKRSPVENEVKIMKRIAQTNPKHKGWQFIRKLIDTFPIEGISGYHTCLVLEPLREPLWLYCSRYAGGVIPPEILKILVQMILHALDYIHSECSIIHTDLNPGNIMIKIEDPMIFQRDARSEFRRPLPEKQLHDRTIYLSRDNYGPLTKPTGIIQLVGFDRAISTTPGELHTGAIQSELYRAPEVILNSGYTYSADIWSLGVLVILP
ncbi:cmgc srpk kinase [Fusarium heterosporum]|uniref:non-specific serine/threonine protein kinase n=1 Tax=Fusarium heterosporum TaxID=42747 RepID=A0A8H5U2L1_FUSHE|nr:cmgc srpk kinase [Fusarium heterosporum]